VRLATSGTLGAASRGRLETRPLAGLGQMRTRSPWGPWDTVLQGEGTLEGRGTPRALATVPCRPEKKLEAVRGQSPCAGAW
jgi:hypothetical protein